MMPVVAQGKGGGEGGVRALVEQKGLMQISDPAALMAIVDSVLAGELEPRSCHVSDMLVADVTTTQASMGCVVFTDACWHAYSQPGAAGAVPRRQNQAAGLLRGVMSFQHLRTSHAHTTEARMTMTRSAACTIHAEMGLVHHLRRHRHDCVC